VAALVSHVLCLQILEAVRPAAARLGLETPLQLWGYFVATCKRNLHIVLCMSPIGDACRWGHMAADSLTAACHRSMFVLSCNTTQHCVVACC
jgi:hypothetical protein